MICYFTELYVNKIAFTRLAAQYAIFSFANILLYVNVQKSEIFNSLRGKNNDFTKRNYTSLLFDFYKQNKRLHVSYSSYFVIIVAIYDAKILGLLLNWFTLLNKVRMCSKQMIGTFKFFYNLLIMRLLASDFLLNTLTDLWKWIMLNSRANRILVILHDCTCD